TKPTKAQRPIDARSETAATSGMFKRALEQRRYLDEVQDSNALAWRAKEALMEPRSLPYAHQGFFGSNALPGRSAKPRARSFALTSATVLRPIRGSRDSSISVVARTSPTVPKPLFSKAWLA